MKRLAILIILIFCLSCGRRSTPDRGIISVSIPPFKYFVEKIAGDNFSVNIMVPAGTNPHIYEPYPDQINRLRNSVAYLSNGYLGFESVWLPRFGEINRDMRKMSLNENIEPIAAGNHHEREQPETADPHYWVSPLCAMKMASSVRDLLISLDPVNTSEYNDNYKELVSEISVIDSMAKSLSSMPGNKVFMIYHPNLAYLARDYSLKEIAVEDEGREPSPLRLRELIDLAKQENIRVIMVQKEFDTKNASAIAGETGCRVMVIDPLSENWYSATTEIIETLRVNFEGKN
jgi:zinc transport system substrate-binding protein